VTQKIIFGNERHPQSSFNYRNMAEGADHCLFDDVLATEPVSYENYFKKSLSLDNQTAKADEGKLQISLVPTQIIRDIAEVRMYGNKKYGDPDNWKTVEKKRYVDALLRHLLAYIDDPAGVDSESGIPHYKHAACNMAFICAMEGDFSTKMTPPINEDDDHE